MDFLVPFVPDTFSPFDTFSHWAAEFWVPELSELRSPTRYRAVAKLSPEESDFLRTVASSQTPLAE